MLGVKFEDDILEDLVEYDSTQLTSDEKSKLALDKIAGGDYWVEIIEKKRKGTITAYEAEAEFAEAYCKRMRESYSYVLNMPLRIKEGQVPKYRMIHATNHADGALLMVDNIFGRWEFMQDIQRGGQMSWFEDNVENQAIDEKDIRKKVISLLSDIKSFRRMNPIMADFYSTYGVVCRTQTVKAIFKDLEKSGQLIVRRIPDKTNTGRISAFFSDEKGKITELRWKG